MTIEIETLAWEKMQGLLPAIVQEYKSGRILMLGYMNKEALKETLNGEHIIFYSRSKQRLWKKGESSNNTLSWKDITADCDKDALLITATQNGPTCHQGSLSCFNRAADWEEFLLNELEELIIERKKNPISKSYTCELFSQGVERIAQKVGEEAVETVIAGIKRDKQELREEAADLIFHLLVLLHSVDVSFQQVIHTLHSRRKSFSP